MITIAPYILPLIGLLFMVLGGGFVLRAFKKSSAIAYRTHRKLGLVYLLVGLALTILGVARL